MKHLFQGRKQMTENHSELVVNEYDLANKMRSQESRSSAFLPQRRFNPLTGSHEGVKLNRHLDTLNRYELSKNIILFADNYERNFLQNKIDKISKVVVNRKLNYAFKGLLGLSVISYYISANNRKDHKKLQRSTAPSEHCDCKGLMFRAAAFVGSLALV